jgi:hypothetical protein
MTMLHECLFYMYFQDEITDIRDVLHARGFSLEFESPGGACEYPTKTTIMLDGETYEVESPSVQLW